MTDPNLVLQETQTTVARAIADGYRHAVTVGELVGQEAAIGDGCTLCDDERARYEARIATLESERKRFLGMVLDRFRGQLMPVIEMYENDADTHGDAGRQYVATHYAAYAQALRDFLAGNLTR